jgi:hypothetical protein
MYDDVNNDVNSQILEQNPETEQQQVEAAPIPEQEAQQPVKPQESWKQLRQQRERAERERDEAYQLIRQMQQQQPQQQQESDDDELNIDPDTYAEGKHLSKVDRKVRKLEEQLRQYQQQSQSQSIESRIIAQYPDFDKVVSVDNIEKLKEDFPELSATLHSSNDLYSKAISTYKLIKKLGISHDNMYDKEQAMVQKNAAKPKPSAAINPQRGDSPLSKANAFENGLTDELRKQLQREMFDAMKAR